MWISRIPKASVVNIDEELTVKAQATTIQEEAIAINKIFTIILIDI